MIENVAAFVVVQCNVELPPEAIDAGFAVSTQIGAGGGVVVTVIVTLQVTVAPLALVAVPV